MNTLVRRKRPAPSFVNVLDTLFNDDFLKKVNAGPTVWNGTTPAVNVKEDANAYTLLVAAPGYEKGDFEIKVEEDTLLLSTISKEVAAKETTEVEAEATPAKEVETYTRREFNYGAFKRSFNLPETVDPTKITANYVNGILTISIPKKEEAKPVPPRTIEIA